MQYDDEDSRVRLKDGDNDYINASRLVVWVRQWIFKVRASCHHSFQTCSHVGRVQRPYSGEFFIFVETP
jgi:hypothetical protein